VGNMSVLLRCFCALLLGSMLLACSEDLSDEARVEQARTEFRKVRQGSGPLQLYNFRQIAAELKAVLNNDSKNLAASELLGEVFFEMGEWEDAGNWLSKARRLGADPATVVPVLAQILLNLREYDKLDGLPFDGLDPEGRSTVQAAKAVALLDRDRPELAKELIGAALQNDPRSPFAEVAGARVAMAVDGYEEARERLTDIVDRYPDYVPAWNLLGDVESISRSPAAAAKAYQKSLNLAPENESTSMNELLMKIYSGNDTRAISDVNEIVTEFPSLKGDVSFNFLRGLSLLQRTDRLYEARWYFYEGMEESDTYPQSLYYLAAIDLELGVFGLEPDFSEKALSSAYQFLRFFPDSVAGMKLAAKIELVRGNYSKVEDIFRPLRYRKKEDAEAMNILARAYLAQDKDQKGIELYARLVALEPNSIDAKARLAAAYLGAEVGDLDIKVGRGLLLQQPEAGEPETLESLDSVETLARKQRDKPGELNLQAGRGLDETNETDQILSQTIELQPGIIRSDQERGIRDSGMDAEELGIRALQRILAIYPGYEQADILIILRHLHQRRIVDAIAAAQAHRLRNPSSALAYSLLGRAYLANGENDKARTAFENALSLRPGDADAANGLADLELRKGNYDAAREYYRTVLKYDQTHTQSWMRLAASYARQGKEKDMLDVLEEASRADPRGTEPRLALVRYYIAKGSTDEATSLLSGFTAAERDLPTTMEVVAAAELATGRYDQALETVDRLLRVHPDAAQYYYLRAKAYAGVGDQKRLLESLNRALELSPDHFYAKLVSTRLALMSGDEDEVQRLMTELRRVAPGSYDVLELEARLAQLQGQQDIASRMWHNVYLRNSTSENLIAYATQRQRQNDIPGAIGLLGNWIEKHKDSVDAREKLAELYVLSNDPGNAILQYRQIVEIAPGNATAWNNLAWLLLNDNAADALQYAERANRLITNSGAMLDTLAMAQLKNDLLPEARRSIDRASALDPDSPEFQRHKAEIMAAEAEKRAAIETMPIMFAGETRYAGRSEERRF